MSEETAAVSIRRFVKMLQGLAELEPELTSLASIKQAAQEATNRFNIAKQAEADAAQVLAGLQEEITTARAEVAALAVAAKEALVAATKEGEAKATELVNAAQTKAASIAQATAIELQAVKSQIAESTRALASLRAEIASAQGEYKDTQEKVDALVRRLGGR